MKTFFGAQQKVEPEKKATEELKPLTETKKLTPEQQQKQAEGKANAVNGYDPALDNHLVSPSKPLGLFGLKVKEVEQRLRNYGAKNYSYAFGKYSRMSLATYLLTIYFDKKRIVGGVSIVPKPPYKRIEPMARDFFIKTFLQGNKLSGFKSQLSNSLIEFKYVGN